MLGSLQSRSSGLGMLDRIAPVRVEHLHIDIGLDILLDILLLGLVVMQGIFMPMKMIVIPANFTINLNFQGNHLV